MFFYTISYIGVLYWFFIEINMRIFPIFTWKYYKIHIIHTIHTFLTFYTYVLKQEKRTKAWLLSQNVWISNYREQVTDRHTQRCSRWTRTLRMRHTNEYDQAWEARSVYQGWRYAGVHRYAPGRMSVIIYISIPLLCTKKSLLLFFYRFHLSLLRVRRKKWSYRLPRKKHHFL